MRVLNISLLFLVLFVHLASTVCPAVQMFAHIWKKIFATNQQKIWHFGPFFFNRLILIVTQTFTALIMLLQFIPQTPTFKRHVSISVWLKMHLTKSLKYITSIRQNTNRLLRPGQQWQQSENHEETGKPESAFSFTSNNVRLIRTEPVN